MNEDFFNKENKKQYLNTLDDKRKIEDTAVAFRQIAPIEEELNTDISCANEEQISYILQNWIVSTHRRYIHLKNLLNEYIDYEIECGFSNQTYNTFRKVTNRRSYNVDASIYEKYPQDDAELYDILVLLFGKPNVNTQYVSHFAFLCLVFSGFKNNEILELSKKDMDFENCTIKGKEISEVFWSVIVNSLKTNIIIGRGGKEIFILNNMIIKHNVNDYVRVLKQTISLCKKGQANSNIPKGLSITTIRLAGMWYSAYLRERNGFPLMLPDYHIKNYQNYKKAYWE